MFQTRSGGKYFSRWEESVSARRGPKLCCCRCHAHAVCWLLMMITNRGQVLPVTSDGRPLCNECLTHQPTVWVDLPSEIRKECSCKLTRRLSRALHTSRWVSPVSDPRYKPQSQQTTRREWYHLPRRSMVQLHNVRYDWGHLNLLWTNCTKN